MLRCALALVAATYNRKVTRKENTTRSSCRARLASNDILKKAVNSSVNSFFRLISLSEFHPDNIFSLTGKSLTLQTRAKLVQSLRLFFINNGFLEVETPLRIPSPAPEEHI